jgi:hypothetical protein
VATLVIVARIIEQAPSHFVVVVSSTGGQRSDLEMAEANTAEEARRQRDRLIGAVVDRALRRGDSIARVQRLQF